MSKSCYSEEKSINSNNYLTITLLLLLASATASTTFCSLINFGIFWPLTKQRRAGFMFSIASFLLTTFSVLVINSTAAGSIITVFGVTSSCVILFQLLTIYSTGLSVRLSVCWPVSGLCLKRQQDKFLQLFTGWLDFLFASVCGLLYIKYKKYPVKVK